MKGHTIGQARELVMRRQILDASIGLYFLEGAIEVLQSRGDGFTHARQECDDFLVRRPGLGDEKQDHADALAAFDQRHGAARDHAALAAVFAPRTPLFRVENVFIDAGLFRPKRLSANALAIGVIPIDRKSRLPDQAHVDDLASADHRLQPRRARLGQKHGGGQRSADMHGGVAHQLIELVGCLCAQDRLVGGAERRKHLGQSTGRSLIALARFFAVDVVQSERQIFDHAGEERDGLLVERVDLVKDHQQDPDTLSAADHGKASSGARASTNCSVVPGFQPFVVEKVIAYAWLLGATGNSDKTIAER
jgi:hypothetical protein